MRLFEDFVSEVETDRWLENKKSLVPAKIEAAWWWISWRIGVAICNKYGHDVIDISTAGPDSGNVHLQCRRCGYTDYQILY